MILHNEEYEKASDVSRKTHYERSIIDKLIKEKYLKGERIRLGAAYHWMLAKNQANGKSIFEALEKSKHDSHHASSDSIQTQNDPLINDEEVLEQSKDVRIMLTINVRAELV